MPVLTRRAALAQKSILNDLLNEITTEIISLYDISSKASLSIKSSNWTLIVDAALSAHPEYAAWVRNLLIAKSAREPGTLAEVEPTDQSHSAEHNRTAVTVAGVRDYGQAIVTTFINRHPTLLHLAFSSFESKSSEPWRFDLLHLVTYQGQSSESTTPLNVFARFPGLQDLDILFIDSNFALQTIRDIFNHVRHTLPQLRSLILKIVSRRDKLSNFQVVIAEGHSSLKQSESFGIVVIMPHDGAASVDLNQFNSAFKFRQASRSNPAVTS
ncbi:hypothetical protein C8J56DRAFT_1057354 [Mycena floridula]|nr:hypothetical protein C8J56DRAFT_1057354 [Mycena floridula]